MSCGLHYFDGRDSPDRGLRLLIQVTPGQADRVRINGRFWRLSLGNPGVKLVGEGAFEIRVDFGPGYRVHLVSRSQVLVILVSESDIKPSRATYERC